MKKNTILYIGLITAYIAVAFMFSAIACGIGVSWSGIIQIIRVKITKMVEAALGVYVESSQTKTKSKAK